MLSFKLGNITAINSKECDSFQVLGKDEKVSIWISFPGKKKIEVSVARSRYMYVKGQVTVPAHGVEGI